MWVAYRSMSQSFLSLTPARTHAHARIRAPAAFKCNREVCCCFFFFFLSFFSVSYPIRMLLSQQSPPLLRTTGGLRLLSLSLSGWTPALWGCPRCCRCSGDAAAGAAQERRERQERQRLVHALPAQPGKGAEPSWGARELSEVLTPLPSACPRHTIQQHAVKRRWRWTRSTFWWFTQVFKKTLLWLYLYSDLSNPLHLFIWRQTDPVANCQSRLLNQVWLSVNI